MQTAFPQKVEHVHFIGGIGWSLFLDKSVNGPVCSTFHTPQHQRIGKEEGGAEQVPQKGKPGGRGYSHQGPWQQKRSTPESHDIN